MNAKRIQQLVDGELSQSDRAEMIRELDEHPESWRGVALELLHHQLLTRVMSDHVERTERGAKSSTMDTTVARSTGRPNSVVHRLAIAAIVLLMAVVGYGLGQMQQGQDPMATDDRVPSESHTQRADIGLADALAKCVTPVPDSFRRELLSAGYYLTEDQRLSQVRLPTGDLIEMPVRHFDIHYIGEAAFQ